MWNVNLLYFQNKFFFASLGASLCYTLFLRLLTCSFSGCHRCVREAPKYGAIIFSQWAGCLWQVAADVTTVAGTRLQNGKEVEKASGPRLSVWLANASSVTGRSLWGTQDPETGWTMIDRPLRRACRGDLFRDKNILSVQRETASQWAAEEAVFAGIQSEP